MQRRFEMTVNGCLDLQHITYEELISGKRGMCFDANRPSGPGIGYGMGQAMKSRLGIAKPYDPEQGPTTPTDEHRKVRCGQGHGVPKDKSRS